jgi:Na+/melibiose symporter-like transporter
MLVVMCYAGIYLIRNCEKETIKAALEAQKTRIKENFFKIWANCLRIKSFRKVIVWTLIYMLGFSMLNTVFVYLMTYNAGMDAVQQGVFWTVYVVIVVCVLPFTTYFCNKYGKKPAMLIIMTPAIISSFFFFFTGINSIVDFYIFSALSVTASSAFFTFYVGYSYDCIEIDEFLTGERKEGSMSSLTTFAQKFGSALALYFTGLCLNFTGYDGMAEVQTESALQGILSLGTLFPGILFTVAIIILSTYPVSKKKFELLCTALEKKRAGEEYSTEGFEDIL